ncbi:DUF3945 domain-containing protein [uncultured Duncaniella sp.]|uniref:DUF3945 domain-containing protein n=1 Tax=uncultured Duncaniella sp. TaxID=2768039 RepID=UPI002711EB2C|nr:DUF3945 domain-containing protein [uncultured Duncaniella sp.]
MEQNQNYEEVLIARNNETGQVGAVTGLNEDGTPKMADVKSAKLSDLVKFNKGQNPLEAFLSNFIRQAKNPTTFGFFKVPADRYESVGVAMADFMQKPEENAEILKDFKVDMPQQTQSEMHSQTQSEAPEQKPAEAQATQTAEQPNPVMGNGTSAGNTQQYHHYQAIDESKIDWQNLKEKWGIDRDELAKSGDLKEMLYNRKSKLVTVTPTFGGEKFQIDARLSFRTDAAGNVKVVPHFIHREPKLDQEFEGYKFTKEDKDALKYTGNLGKVVELTGANGEKIPSYVSLDRLTNEIVSVPVKDVYIRDTVGQTKLTIPEVMQLKEGKALPPKEIEGKNGQKYTVVLQVSADRKGIEFVPGGAKKQELSEKNGQTQTQQQSSWLTKDGKIKPITKWAGVPLTPEQQTAYVKGEVVEMKNMVDKQGQPCTVYLKFNPDKQRPNTSLNDPRVKVAEESRTQKAVNNDGLTNEATKNISDPLQKGQTAPKDDAQQKQQRKPKGQKL